MFLPGLTLGHDPPTHASYVGDTMSACFVEMGS
jgi:hypothetical protein